MQICTVKLAFTTTIYYRDFQSCEDSWTDFSPETRLHGDLVTFSRTDMQWRPLNVN